MEHSIVEVLVPVGVLSVLGISVVLFTRTITDYILRKRMIDKGLLNEEAQGILKKDVVENKYGSLKWGLIILFAGISLVILEYVQLGPNSPLPYGLFAISVSLGFLVYYFLIKDEVNK